eukprot:129473-Amphidinium_carterae.1
MNWFLQALTSHQKLGYCHELLPKSSAPKCTISVSGCYTGICGTVLVNSSSFLLVWHGGFDPLVVPSEGRQSETTAIELVIPTGGPFCGNHGCSTAQDHRGTLGSCAYGA